MCRSVKVLAFLIRSLTFHGQVSLQIDVAKPQTHPVAPACCQLFSLTQLNGGGMEVIGGVSGVLAIVGVVAKCAKKLNEIKDSYDSVALNIQLAAIQLATIRDALEAIAEWRLSSHTENQASKNLDATLAESLKGCAVLITVIDGKLGEAGYAPGVKRKIRHLWLEDVLKGYMSNLDGQVRALQLLLTSFQWLVTSRSMTTN